MSFVKLTVYVEMEDPTGTPINACVKLEEGYLPLGLFGSILKVFGGAYLKPTEYFMGLKPPISIQEGVGVPE